MKIDDCLKSDLSYSEKKELILSELSKNEEHTIDVLLKCLKIEDKKIFNMAFSILSNVESPILVEKLINELKSKNSSIRSIIYELLLNCGKANIKYLKTALNDTDYHIRKLIIDVFTNSKLELDKEYIQKFLDDDNLNVKYAICEYIIKNNKKEILPILKSKLKTETDEWIVTIILEAIGKLGNSEDIKEILNYPTTNILIMKTILSIMSKMGTQKQLIILLPLLTINNKELKKYVIKSLYELITYNNITKEDIINATPDINYIITQ